MFTEAINALSADVKECEAVIELYKERMLDAKAKIKKLERLQAQANEVLGLTAALEEGAIDDETAVSA